MTSKRKTFGADAARWMASVALIALVASAATSTLFLALRPKPAPSPTASQIAAIDQRQFAVHAPLLQQAAEAELASGTQLRASGPKQVDVKIELDHAAAQRVPMVSTASNMLTELPATPWHMQVVSVQEQWRVAQVIDIRRSTSLRQPGYFGLVLFEVDRLTRRAEQRGQLPAQPPSGFEVITLAKYNELEQSREYQRQLPAGLPAREVLVAKHYDDWQPVSPVPENLPPQIGTHFHETLAACDSAAPDTETHRETHTFYFSPLAGTWTLQPRGEPAYFDDP